MTSRFNLTAASGTLSLGFDGSVAQNNATVGNWRTGTDNSIQVKLADGTSTTLAVSWGFNANNQLELSANNAVVANFQTDAAVSPGFELKSGVLRVTPNRLSGFSFELRGDWALTPNHDLQFTATGVTSTLVGMVADPFRRNRFLFMFHDNVHPALLHQLAFEGHWETPASGEANLRYVYKDRNGKDQVFELPGKLLIDRTTNQLRYDYVKGGNQSIDFDGTLAVTPDLQIVYSIGRTKTATGDTVVNESVIGIGVRLTKNNFTGDLEFEARRLDGQTTTLAISGSYVGVLGPNAKLVAGFTFKQIHAANQMTQTTVGFQGALQFKNGSTVEWVFSSTNAATRTISLAVNADIVLSPRASADARLNVTTAGGQVQGVTLLLGVSF